MPFGKPDTTISEPVSTCLSTKDVNLLRTREREKLAGLSLIPASFNSSLAKSCKVSMRFLSNNASHWPSFDK